MVITHWYTNHVFFETKSMKQVTPHNNVVTCEMGFFYLTI